VDAINNLAPPKTRKELRRFLGLVNYYRDLWPRRSHVLAPLTALTSKTVKWKWTEECQIAFDTMKRVMARTTILQYPDFNKPFHIYTDASAIQLGAVIVQEERPIAFYSRKLNPAQTRYTTTERELLSIVEVLKEFKSILFGQELIIHTDHENLTYKKFNSDRVMRWRLFIEEYSPDLQYIKGEHNTVADALSRLDILFAPIDEAHVTDELRSHLYAFGADELDDSFPLRYSDIKAAQDKDEDLMKVLTKSLEAKNDKYHIRSFHGGGNSFNIICYKTKIVIPESLQDRVIDWYHHFLGHPGINKTEETIGQHLWWPKMAA